MYSEVYEPDPSAIWWTKPQVVQAWAKDENEAVTKVKNAIARGPVVKGAVVLGLICEINPDGREMAWILETANCFEGELDSIAWDLEPHINCSGVIEAPQDERCHGGYSAGDEFTHRGSTYIFKDEDVDGGILARALVPDEPGSNEIYRFTAKQMDEEVVFTNNNNS
jgi:hypothetical protein